MAAGSILLARRERAAGRAGACTIAVRLAARGREPWAAHIARHAADNMAILGGQELQKGQEG